MRTAPEISGTNIVHPLQEWEGYVVEIGDSDFVANIVDLTSGKTTFPTEQATIPKQEISERDASRMQIGSIFRWVISYEQSILGTKKCVSQIVFLEPPIITATDLAQSREWARNLSQRLTE